MSGPPPLPKKKGDERRRDPRQKLGVRARITSPKSISGHIGDISRTGLLLVVERPPLIPVGKEVHLQFQLPGQSKPIRARAEVMRHQGRTAMGLRFVMLPLDEVQAIEAYIEKTK